jgi:hypothetical protein
MGERGDGPCGCDDDNEANTCDAEDYLAGIVRFRQ